jgi:hypothetical protein
VRRSRYRQVSILTTLDMAARCLFERVIGRRLRTISARFSEQRWRKQSPAPEFSNQLHGHRSSPIMLHRGVDLGELAFPSGPRPAYSNSSLSVPIRENGKVADTLLASAGVGATE